jgi:hypothetical protein
MARTPQNPDRNFSASGDPEEPEDHRPADKRDNIPAYEDAALRRSGEVISSAALNAKKRQRRR